VDALDDRREDDVAVFDAAAFLEDLGSLGLRDFVVPPSEEEVVFLLFFPGAWLAALGDDAARDDLG